MKCKHKDREMLFNWIFYKLYHSQCIHTYIPFSGWTAKTWFLKHSQATSLYVIWIMASLEIYSVSFRWEEWSSTKCSFPSESGIRSSWKGAHGRWGEWQQQQWDRLAAARVRKRQDQTPFILQWDTVSPMRRKSQTRREDCPSGFPLFIHSVFTAFFAPPFLYFLLGFWPLIQIKGIEYEDFCQRLSRDPEDSPKVSVCCRNAYCWIGNVESSQPGKQVVHLPQQIKAQDISKEQTQSTVASNFAGNLQIARSAWFTLIMTNEWLNPSTLIYHFLPIQIYRLNHFFSSPF